jgi:CRP-like cAMP-binding protein
MTPSDDAITPPHRALLRGALGFERLSEVALEDLAARAVVSAFKRNEVIFHPQGECTHFYIVAQGLVRVSIYAPSGFRLTYLLARPGEPINLVGPVTGASRSIAAEAVRETVLLGIRRESFVAWARNHPDILISIIDILGKAVDSANLRILDMVEKRVEQRLVRVLHTLYVKFGSPLHVTSAELAELAGTTTESTLRSLGHMRKKGLIRSSRGRIHLLNPALLADAETERLWL